MSLDKQKAFLDTFEQFSDYHFIWKFEKPMTDLKLPKNVIIRPWLPQSDILAHPNIKAFITHGGKAKMRSFLRSKISNFSFEL